MNCASSSTNNAASANSVTTSHRALATGFLRLMHNSALSIARTPKNQKNAKGLSDTGLLALRVRRIPQCRDRMRLRGQPLEVVDEAIARVFGVLVVHADVDRFLRAHLLAIAAEDAAKLVDLVNERIAVPVFVLARDQLDTVGRADLRAEAAGDAFGATLLVGQHAVRAAPARGERPVFGGLFLGVLHRDLGTQQMAECQRHALQRGAQVGRLLRGPLHDLHADRHYAASCGTEPETMRP